MEKNANTEDMKTLSSCINKLVQDGYTENFQVTDNGLYSIIKDKNYSPADVDIVNFFRFEGASDPADSSILYAVETNDGVKGTLTDAYGSYSDPQVGKFIQQVESFGKKQAKTT